MAQKTKVWEGAIRLTHWALALAILGLFITGEFNLFFYHIILGKIVLMLVVFRVLWGFVGSKPARILPGLFALGNIPGYMGRLFSKKAEYTAGHTPLGWAMTFALLLAAGLQALLGLSMEKTYEGVTYAHELSPLFSNVDLKHTFNFIHTEIMPAVIITLVSVHVLAVFWYLWRKKQNLVTGIITGVKMVDVAPKTDFKKLILPAIIVLAVSVLIVWGLLDLPNLLGLVPPTSN